MSQVAPPPPLLDAGGAEPLQPPPKPKRRRLGRSSFTRDVVEVLALALALYVVITFALQTVRVDGTSMVPTLGNNDLLFADKITYHLHAPSRGDIIILQPPADPDRDFIKRIIGVPGDELRIVPDYSGDGQKPHAAIEFAQGGDTTHFELLREPYLPDQSSDPWVDQAQCCDAQGHYSTDGPHWFTVPAEQYFVMGDNRNASKDSRTIGLIPRDHVLGRAWVRIWPLGRLGFLGTGPTISAALAVPVPLLRLRRRRSR